MRQPRTAGHWSSRFDAWDHRARVPARLLVRCRVRRAFPCRDYNALGPRRTADLGRGVGPDRRARLTTFGGLGRSACGRRGSGAAEHSASSRCNRTRGSGRPRRAGASGVGIPGSHIRWSRVGLSLAHCYLRMATRKAKGRPSVPPVPGSSEIAPKSSSSASKGGLEARTRDYPEHDFPYVADGWL